MTHLRNKHILFIFCFFVSLNINSQIKVFGFSDIGENNVSNGLFLKTSGFGSYQFNKFTIKAGAQIDIISQSSNHLTGSLFSFSRKFTIKNFAFDVAAFYTYNPYSELIHETNWGLVLEKNTKHFIIKAGTNFRTYKITNKAIDLYNIEGNTKIHENWNIMYLLQYNLKPSDNNWNVGVSITNIDYFVINQETNPVFFLQGKYKFKAPLSLFIETWYKSAGSFNISVNYFGYFIRTGLVWEIK